MAKSAPRVIALLILLCTGAALAQIAIPTLGSRGDPARSEELSALIDAFTAELRARVAASGLEVSNAELITPGIAGSLDPEYAKLIADIDDKRYAVSGEIAVAEDERAQSPFVVNMIVVDAEQNRATDLISRPLSEESLRMTAAGLARVIVRFTEQELALPPGDAGLFVSSQPGEADVYLDGLLVGRTSELDVIMLAPGRYQLEIRKEGFLPEVRTVELRSGTTTFSTVPLTAIVGGSIQVVSTPPAEVFLDGESQGYTPLFIPAPPGVQSVRLERDGFEPVIATVPVRNYRVSRLDLQLEPEREPLLYWSLEPEYLVLIDGIIQPNGHAPSVVPGLIEVEVRRGRERYVHQVVLPANGAFELNLQTGELTRLGSR
ncbi:MAG TPA: PEGA domain-containing protein [Trueperaceae bacterium]